MKTKVKIWFAKGKPYDKEIEHDDLLPCPFCGSHNVHAGAACSMSYHVQCRACKASTGSIWVPAVWRSKKCLEEQLILKAVKKWNRRTESDKKPLTETEKKILVACKNGVTSSELSKTTDIRDIYRLSEALEEVLAYGYIWEGFSFQNKKAAGPESFFKLTEDGEKILKKIESKGKSKCAT